MTMVLEFGVQKTFGYIVYCFDLKSNHYYLNPEWKEQIKAMHRNCAHLFLFFLKHKAMVSKIN